MSLRLCLGGPKDGEWVELPEGVRWYRVHESMPMSLTKPSSELVQHSSWDTGYHVVVWIDGPVEVELLVHESVSPGSTLRRLIERYKP